MSSLGLGRRSLRSRYKESCNMESLSCAEMEVANEFCKGYSDKEVADNLNKSYWTVKTQKKEIYRKLGISKETELLLYMICEKMKRDFDLKEIRKHGLELLFSVLFLIIQLVGDYHTDMRSCRMQGRTRTSVRTGRGKRNFNEFDLSDELFGKQSAKNIHLI